MISLLRIAYIFVFLAVSRKKSLPPQIQARLRILGSERLGVAFEYEYYKSAQVECREKKQQMLDDMKSMGLEQENMKQECRKLRRSCIGVPEKGFSIVFMFLKNLKVVSYFIIIFKFCYYFMLFSFVIFKNLFQFSYYFSAAPRPQKEKNPARTFFS